MKSINTIIRNGIKENEKEIKEILLDINAVKELMNQGLSFEIKLAFNFNTNLLEVKYEFKKNDNEMSVYFTMNNDVFTSEYLEISINLMEYAFGYFNNEEIKFNIGDFDGDNYVTIKDYLKSLIEENEELHLMIVDEQLDEEL